MTSVSERFLWGACPRVGSDLVISSPLPVVLMDPGVGGGGVMVVAGGADLVWKSRLVRVLPVNFLL